MFRAKGHSKNSRAVVGNEAVPLQGVGERMEPALGQPDSLMFKEEQSFHRDRYVEDKSRKGRRGMPRARPESSKRNRSGVSGVQAFATFRQYLSHGIRSDYMQLGKVGSLAMEKTYSKSQSR